MVIRSFVLAAPLVLAAALAAPAAGGMTPLQTVRISAQLYERGLADGDALLVLAAAKLRREAPDLRPRAQPRLPRGASAPVEAPEAAPVGWQDMMASARALAGGDEALLGLIDDVEAASSKGVATGQVYSISEIGDGATDTYDALPFQGGDYAEVYVESRDGSDLNLYIYDAQGRLVCSDTDISAISYCGWRPAESGSFTIAVENRGQGAAGYSLMTN